MYDDLLTADQDARLRDYLCVVCESEMDPDEIEDNGRVSCSNRCRQALYRLRRS